LRTLKIYPYFVTPAKAGVQKVLKRLDTGFRQGDELQNFRRKQVSLCLTAGKRILEKITDGDSFGSSATDTGVNRSGFAIIDDDNPLLLSTKRD